MTLITARNSRLGYISITLLLNHRTGRLPSGFPFVSRSPDGILRDGEVMRAPYGLEIIENCSPVATARIDFSVISLHLRWNRCPRLLLLPSTRKGDAVCGRAIATRRFRVMQRQREALDFIRGPQNPHIGNFGIGRRARPACNSHWKAL